MRSAISPADEVAPTRVAGELDAGSGDASFGRTQPLLLDSVSAPAMSRASFVTSVRKKVSSLPRPTLPWRLEQGPPSTTVPTVAPPDMRLEAMRSARQPEQSKAKAPPLRDVVEAVGFLCMVGGIAILSIAIALIVLGLGAMAWANFGQARGGE